LAGALTGHGTPELLERLPQAVTGYVPSDDGGGADGRRDAALHTVNRATGNRVESRDVDSETGKPVAEEEQA
jgi:hypothetical protein